MFLLFRYIKIEETFFKTCPMLVCQLADNIIHYIYMISYITNIFFYIKFNKPFRHGIKCCLDGRRVPNKNLPKEAFISNWLFVTGGGDTHWVRTCIST